METPFGDKPMPKKLARLFDGLLEDEWVFLDEPWQMCPKLKTFHRSECKQIARVQDMKAALKKRLAPILVFSSWPKYGASIISLGRLTCWRKASRSCTFSSLERLWIPYRNTCYNPHSMSYTALSPRWSVRC